VTAGRLRLLTIALFVAAAVLTAVSGEESGPVFAAGVGCFLLGVLAFFRWRRAQHDDARAGKVFDREEKTAPAEGDAE
jgi:hypothetical protein